MFLLGLFNFYEGLAIKLEMISEQLISVHLVHDCSVEQSNEQFSKED